jgi:hypothetical protein
MVVQAQPVESLREHLLSRWLSWGIAPLVVCALIVGLLVMWGPTGPIEGKQQTRLAFEIVFGVAAAVFLAGFYLDGHWTNNERLARRIFTAAGGAEERDPESWAQSAAHRTALQSNAEIALNSVRASADAITIMGVAIGLVAIVSVLMGLPGVHAAQILLMGLFYQFFIFSRHPYYLQVAETAVAGQLLPSPDEKAGSSARRR